MAKVDVAKMLEGMRPLLERDEAEGKLAGISVADLADAVSHPKAAEVIDETMALEVTSVKEGEPAPDFTLPWLPGSGEGRGAAATLSDQFGERPVALVFGSYT
jgi:hypothetical protein